MSRRRAGAAAGGDRLDRDRRSAGGGPLAYEVFPGNTLDKTTLKPFLDKIEKLYGKARRVWVMDRGLPTQATLE